MKKMKKNLVLAVMALCMMTACGEKKNFDMLGGEWNVVSVGELVVPDSADAFLGFDIAGQLIYGSTGCNRLTGSMPAGLDPAVSMFAAMGSTRRMCADMSVEDALLPALGQAVDFRVDGNNLYLLDAAGNAVVALQKR